MNEDMGMVGWEGENFGAFGIMKNKREREDWIDIVVAWDKNPGSLFIYTMHKLRKNTVAC